MTQRSWEDVRAAFVALGCEVIDREHRAIIARGAARLYRLRKISPVPVKVQREAIEVLELNEAEYLKALP